MRKDAKESMSDVTIGLLADFPELIEAVARIRWQEWGHIPEPGDLAWWIDVTQREAGRDALPITWVAVDAHGNALGAAGLDEQDLAERRNLTPWAVGVIVAPQWRNQGVGEKLMHALHSWARQHNYPRLWVATGGRAVRFYEKCGWQVAEMVERANGEIPTVLSIELDD
jgi:GNAT superfamily N-acetyltransferase